MLLCTEAGCMLRFENTKPQATRENITICWCGLVTGSRVTTTRVASFPYVLVNTVTAELNSTVLFESLITVFPHKWLNDHNI